MSLKVLIIDDDEILCEELAEILVGNGYTVNTALDGQKGLEAIRKDPCDLVLLDIKMPHLDGLAFLQEIKRDASAPKVIVLSANHAVNVFFGEAEAVPQDHSQPLLRLADGIMSKPYDVEVLLGMIRTLLSLPRS